MTNPQSTDGLVQEHVIYAIANALVRPYPYPHIYVENVFPEDFYRRLRTSWPDARHFVTLSATGRVPKGTYDERVFMPLVPPAIAALPEHTRTVWSEIAAWMLSGRFLNEMLGKFEPYARERFGDGLENVDFQPEVLIVRDHTNYNLGPHTDATHKVLAMLFYCPDDASKKHLGTSLYRPNDPAFRCEGGPHYPHAQFTKVATMEYKPNSLFAFFKTDRSFHGVEPIQDGDVLRDLMLYDIRVAAPHK